MSFLVDLGPLSARQHLSCPGWCLSTTLARQSQYSHARNRNTHTYRNRNTHTHRNHNGLLRNPAHNPLPICTPRRWPPAVVGRLPANSSRPFLPMPIKYPTTSLSGALPSSKYRSPRLCPARTSPFSESRIAGFRFSRSETLCTLTRPTSSLSSRRGSQTARSAAAPKPAPGPDGRTASSLPRRLQDHCGDDCRINAAASAEGVRWRLQDQASGL